MAIDVELLENKTPEQYTQQVNDDLLENTLSKDYLVGVEETDDEIAQIKLSLDDDGSSFDEEENILTSLIELSEGLESIHEFLSVNANGPTADAMRFADVALEAYSKKAGMTVKLPDHAGLGSTIMRRDYRAVALESIGETIADVVKRVIEAVKKAAAVFMQYVTKFFRYFATYRRKLKIIRAEAVRVKEAKVAVVSKRIDLPKSLSYSFQINGKTLNRPADILKSGSGFVDMMTKFADANIAYLEKVVELADNWTTTALRKEDTLKSATALANAMDVEQVMRHSFAGTDIHLDSDSYVRAEIHGLPGNRTMTVIAQKPKDDDLKGYTQALGNITSYVRQGTGSAETKSLEVMTPEEIIASVDGCLKMLDVMEQYEKRARKMITVKDRIIKKFGVKNVFGDFHTSVLKNDFTSLLIAISRYIRNIMKFGTIWLTTATTTVKDVATFATLSLKEYHVA